MFADHLAASIAAAPLCALDDLVKKAAAAWGAGELDDDSMEKISLAIRARQVEAKSSPAALQTFQRPAGLFPKRSRQGSPKSPEKIDRRRTLGTSSTLPPTLRARFTLGEVAVLTVIIMDVRLKGYCDASVAEIGQRAGCCRTLVRNAIRMASTLGLIAVMERPRRGAKNLTNRITVIGAELKAWIDRGPKLNRGQKTNPLRRDSAFRGEEAAKLKPYPTAMRRRHGT